MSAVLLLPTSLLSKNDEMKKYINDLMMCYLSISELNDRDIYDFIVLKVENAWLQCF